MTVRAGEVVGVGGLVGSGRTSLINALCGVAEGVSGRMWLDGQEITPPKTPLEAKRHGICMVPEDRKGSGLFMSMTSRENMVLGNLKDCCRFGFVQRPLFFQRADTLGREYGIQPKLLGRRAQELSGGNQQKLLLARAGNGPTRILLADEATRGIDVGAKSIVLQTLRRLADAGLAIVFVSSELEEVAAVSDRVYVLKDGRIAGYLDGSEPITEDRILSIAFETEVVADV